MKSYSIAFIALSLSPLQAKTSTDSYNRSYTCNGESVDCIFNVGADLTTSERFENNPTTRTFQRMAGISTSTLMISNNSDTTIAVWGILTMAPATMLARIPVGKTAELIYPSYISKLFIVTDELMSIPTVALALKNGPDAFTTALTEQNPDGREWIIEDREPLEQYQVRRNNKELLNTYLAITPQSPKMRNSITATITTSMNKLNLRITSDTLAPKKGK